MNGASRWLDAIACGSVAAAKASASALFSNVAMSIPFLN
jgi:hypothetical protein